MPKSKTQPVLTESTLALDALEPADFPPVAKARRTAEPAAQLNDEIGIVGKPTELDQAKKTKARSRKTGEQKPRARARAKNSKKAFGAPLDFSVNDSSALAAADVTEDTELENDVLKPARLTDAVVIATKTACFCEFCKLDDADFAAAYKLMKTTANRRKQTAELEAIQTPVFIAAPDELGPLPRLPKKLINCAGALAVIAVVAMIWMEESSYTRATSLSDFGNQTFVTPDRESAIKFLHNSVALDSTTGGTTVVKARRWQDNWRDHLSIIFNKPEQTLWLKSLPQGFQAQDGSMYYSKGSAEMKVIESMLAVRNGAEKMYQAQGHYPVNSDELASVCAPGSVAVSAVNVNEETSSNLVTNQGETSFEHGLKTGQKFGREKETPNSVSCLEVKSEPAVSSDFNSYGWKTNAFFVHGFDSKGQLIRGTNSNSALLLTLKNGRRSQNLPEVTAARPSQPTSVWIYTGDAPNENNIRWGFFAAAILTILTIAGVVGKRVNDNVMSH